MKKYKQNKNGSRKLAHSFGSRKVRYRYIHINYVLASLHFFLVLLLLVHHKLKQKKHQKYSYIFAETTTPNL